MKTIENGDFEMQCRDCSIVAHCDKEGRLKDVSVAPSALIVGMSRHALAACQSMPLATLCPDPSEELNERVAQTQLNEHGVVIDSGDHRTARQVMLRMIVRQREV